MSGVQDDEALERGRTDHYLDTALYDFEYRDREDDVEWYRDVATSFGSSLQIVELGAGTGRVTIPLAKAGHHITAIDRMASMLEALKRKCEAERCAAFVTPLEADVTHSGLADGCADLVISPFNVLMHLYDWRALQAAFAEAHRLLKPGGRFVFDVQMPDLDWLMWDPEARHSVTYFRHPTTKQRLVYSTNHVYDPVTQIVHVRIYYDEAPARGRTFVPGRAPVHTVKLTQRQVFPQEIEILAAHTGFALERHEGDFENRSLRGGDESQVVVLRRVG